MAHFLKKQATPQEFVSFHFTNISSQRCVGRQQ